MDEKQKQALLEEASYRYPVGTQFYSAYREAMGDTKALRTVTSGNRHLKITTSSGDLGICTSDGCYMYFRGQWAEIIQHGTPDLDTILDHLDKKIQLMEERGIK